MLTAFIIAYLCIGLVLGCAMFVLILNWDTLLSRLFKSVVAGLLWPLTLVVAGLLAMFGNVG